MTGLTGLASRVVCVAYVAIAVSHGWRGRRDSATSRPQSDTESQKTRTEDTSSIRTGLGVRSGVLEQALPPGSKLRRGCAATPLEAMCWFRGRKGQEKARK